MLTRNSTFFYSKTNNCLKKVAFSELAVRLSVFLRDILVIVTELWILFDRSEEAEDVINLENKPLVSLGIRN